MGERNTQTRPENSQSPQLLALITSGESCAASQTPNARRQSPNHEASTPGRSNLTRESSNLEKNNSISSLNSQANDEVRHGSSHQSLGTNNSSDCVMTYDSDNIRSLSTGGSANKINAFEGSAARLDGVPMPDSPIFVHEDDHSSLTSQPDDHRPNQFTIGPPKNDHDDNPIFAASGSDEQGHSIELYGHDGCDLGDDENWSYNPNKKVIVGICAMDKKAQSKPMKEILRRLEDYFEYIQTLVFEESVILNKPIEDWPICDCLISFHSKGFPLSKAIEYARLRRPFLVNDLDIQYDIQDRRKVYKILEEADIELPRYAVLDRDSANPEDRELVESDDHIEVADQLFNKPFVEKPISAEDHNICIYYPAHAGGGSQRLFRKIGCRSSVYSNESHVRKTGSYIYEEFMPTDGTDVKVYTAGPDYAHAEARKSPALDGKVERDVEGKEIRYPVILSNKEKLIARKVCLAFKQTVCGFDLLRANGNSYVCDVNGFSFVKSSMKYYEDCSKILGNMMLRALAPQLHIPWSIPFQLDDPPFVPTTFGRMMELRCVIAVIRHGDRTPKQKMKLEVKHQKFFELYHKYGNPKNGQAKLKKPKQLQEVLDIARYLLGELPDQPLVGEVVEPRVKLKQLKSVLEMYGHFSGINRKVQLKYQPNGRPRRSSSEDDSTREPSLVLILKWGGELTPAGRVQAEDLGRCFRRLYPASGDYSGPQGLGLLRLHSTFRHDLKIYASDEGRVQMTAAAFAKGFLALEGELTPILFQMVKSANTNGLLDNDCESSKCQKIVKDRLHDIMQKDRDLTAEEMEILNPTHAPSIDAACKFIGSPYQACEKVHKLIKELNALIKSKRQDSVFTTEYSLYHGETWDLLQRRWAKLEKDFKFPRSKRFDISKIPDIYDCIKYDLQHNQHTLQFQFARELHTYAKALADIVIPQEYGMTSQEKIMISLGTCSPLLRKIQADLLHDADSTNDDEAESVNRLDPKYSHGVSSPDRHVRTRLYFTSESHIHSLVTALQYGGLLDIKRDEQWKRSMEFLSAISELNYLSQIVIMLYEDPTKDPTSDDRFHVEIHFSSGVINRMSQQSMPTEPQGPGFRPHLHNKSYSNASSSSITSHRDSCDASQQHAQKTTIIKEEPTDDERSDGESRTTSKSSSNCISSNKSISPENLTGKTSSLSVESKVNKLSLSETPTSASSAESATGDPEIDRSTLTEANTRRLSMKIQQRCLSRSYSATSYSSATNGPLGLQEIFKKNSEEGQTGKDGASPPKHPEANDGSSSQRHTLCESSIDEVHDNSEEEDESQNSVKTTVSADRVVLAGDNHRAATATGCTTDPLHTTPKLPAKNDWKTYEQYLASELSGTPHKHHHFYQRRYRFHGGNQTGNHLIQMSPTYHTIHHLNLSPSTVGAMNLSSSMSTSPQQVSGSLIQRYALHKQQQQQPQQSQQQPHQSKTMGMSNKHSFTISASMPIQYKTSQNPRACSVADVSQYCGGPSSLISTAVISGSSPELVAVCPYSPTIRPLETLHNELSLKQFIDFIQRLTRNHRISAIQGPDGLTGTCTDNSNGAHSGTDVSQTSSWGMHDSTRERGQKSSPVTDREGSKKGNNNTESGAFSSQKPNGASPSNSNNGSVIWSGPPSSFASPARSSSPNCATDLKSVQLELEKQSDNLDIAIGVKSAITKLVSPPSDSKPSEIEPNSDCASSNTKL